MTNKKSESNQEDDFSLEDDLLYFSLKVKEALNINETSENNIEESNDLDDDFFFEELEIEEYLSERPVCQACGDFVEPDNGSLICYGCLPNEVKFFVESIK